MFKTILSMAIVCAFRWLILPQRWPCRWRRMSPPRLHLIPQIFNSLVAGVAAAGVGSEAVVSPAAAAVAAALHIEAMRDGALLRIAVMGSAVEARATAVDTVVDGMPEGTDTDGTAGALPRLVPLSARRPALTTITTAAITTATGVGSAPVSTVLS